MAHGLLIQGGFFMRRKDIKAQVRKQLKIHDPHWRGLKEKRKKMIAKAEGRKFSKEIKPGARFRKIMTRLVSDGKNSNKTPIKSKPDPIPSRPLEKNKIKKIRVKKT